MDGELSVPVEVCGGGHDGCGGKYHCFLRELGGNIPPAKVLLMPEGITAEALRARAPMLVELCRLHGYRYCQRLHIELFGQPAGNLKHHALPHLQNF